MSYITPVDPKAYAALKKFIEDLKGLFVAPDLRKFTPEARGKIQAGIDQLFAGPDAKEDGILTVEQFEVFYSRLIDKFNNGELYDLTPEHSTYLKRPEKSVTPRAGVPVSPRAGDVDPFPENPNVRSAALICFIGADGQYHFMPILDPKSKDASNANLRKGFESPPLSRSGSLVASLVASETPPPSPRLLSSPGRRLIFAAGGQSVCKYAYGFLPPDYTHLVKYASLTRKKKPDETPQQAAKLDEEFNAEQIAAIKLNNEMAAKSPFFSHIHYVVDKRGVIHRYTPFCNQGDLSDVVDERKVELDETKINFYGHDIEAWKLDVMLQLAQALADLEQAGVTHNDIKLENIFCIYDPTTRRLRLVIGDFGYAAKPGSPANFFGGTEVYLPIEYFIKHAQSFGGPAESFDGKDALLGTFKFVYKQIYTKPKPQGLERSQLQDNFKHALKRAYPSVSDAILDSIAGKLANWTPKMKLGDYKFTAEELAVLGKDDATRIAKINILSREAGAFKEDLLCDLEKILKKVLTGDPEKVQAIAAKIFAHYPHYKYDAVGEELSVEDQLAQYGLTQEERDALPDKESAAVLEFIDLVMINARDPILGFDIFCREAYLSPSNAFKMMILWSRTETLPEFEKQMRLCDPNLWDRFERAARECAALCAVAPDFPNLPEYAGKKDAWAMGVVFFQLLFDRLPDFEKYDHETQKYVDREFFSKEPFLCLAYQDYKFRWGGGDLLAWLKIGLRETEQGREMVAQHEALMDQHRTPAVAGVASEPGLKPTPIT